MRALHVRASHIFISTQTTVSINFYSWRGYTSLFTHSQLSELTTLAATATFHSYTYSTVRVDDCNYLSHASLYNIIQLSELSAVATWATPHSVPSQSLLPLYLKMAPAGNKAKRFSSVNHYTKNNGSVVGTDYCSYQSYTSLFALTQLSELSPVAVEIIYFTLQPANYWSCSHLSYTSSYIHSTVGVDYSNCRSYTLFFTPGQLTVVGTGAFLHYTTSQLSRLTTLAN